MGAVPILIDMTYTKRPALQRGWTPDNTFGERLAIVRARMGWSTKAAALACGVSDDSWRLYERTDRKPRDLEQTARRIADQTGCDLIWLITGDTLEEDGPGDGHSVLPTLPKVTTPEVASTGDPYLANAA